MIGAPLLSVANITIYAGFCTSKGTNSWRKTLEWCLTGFTSGWGKLVRIIPASFLMPKVGRPLLILLQI